MSASSILVADDDTAIRTVLNQALSRAGYEVRLTGNAATLWRWVSQGEGDLVITDVVMPDENAFDLLPRIKKLRPNLPVIVMSAQNTFMTAIRASERGAYEYLPKPFDLKELIAIVGRALAEPKERPIGPSEESEFDSIPLVGRSPAMQEIYRVLARLMQTDLTVMISGEYDAIAVIADSAEATVTSPAPERNAEIPAMAAAPVFPRPPATTSTWPYMPLFEFGFRGANNSRNSPGSLRLSCALSRNCTGEPISPTTISPHASYCGQST